MKNKTGAYNIEHNNMSNSYRLFIMYGWEACYFISFQA